MPDTLQERDGDSVFPFARERRDWKEKLWIFGGYFGKISKENGMELMEDRRNVS